MDYIHGTYAYIANSNFISAIENLKIGRYDVVCFYGQQCAEKYLKQELLISNKKEDVRGLLSKHNLTAMVRFIADKDLADKTEEFRALSSYYYETRYPGDEYYDAGIKEAKMAIQTATAAKERFERLFTTKDGVYVKTSSIANNKPEEDSTIETKEFI